MDDYLESNRALWNDLAALHEAAPSWYYDLAGFQAGRSTLKSIEREELGDVSGKSLLHLMCHFGLDTLSWARLGARVTGVDFSDRATDHARRLSAEAGLDARFVCSNIYDLPNRLDGTFDIVFSSYGVLRWLPDLARWAEVIAHFLKPGGVFALVEYHPLANIFGEDVPDLQVRYPYFHGPEPQRMLSEGTYANPNLDYHGVQYLWDHSISAILNALLAAGLRIESMREFPVCDYPRFAFLEQGPDGWWRWNDQPNGLPFLFSLKATK